jgi:threonine aldolase
MATLGGSWKDHTWKAGAHCLSLGGTKAGMMYGEALVLFDKELITKCRFMQKRLLQLPSKTRFIAAQFEALLTNDTGQRYAAHANLMARKLCALLDEHRAVRVTMPVEANGVFAIMPPHWIKELQELIPFYVWNDQTNEVRLMCSWDTTEAEIEQFAQALTKLSAGLSMVS